VQIEELTRQDATILRPVGRLDSSTMPAVQERVLAVLARRPKHLVIDFRDLDYVNSTGLRVMLMAAKKLKVDNGRFTLCGMKANVREVFEISGFHKIIEIVDDCAAVIADA
jgi:anti-anti-sigma factor